MIKMPYTDENIYNIDCFDFFKKTKDDSIDLMILDPPYNENKDFPNDNMPLDEFINFTGKWALESSFKLKKNGSFYCFINEEQLFNLKQIFDKYFIFRRLLVWNFEGFFNGFHRNYDNRCEYVLFYTKSDEYTFNIMKEKPSDSTIKRWKPYADENGNIPFENLTPPMQIRQSKENYDANPINIYRGLYQGNCFKINRQRFKLHPTQKPEDLINKLIKISSNPGDVVADFFAGSGTVPFCAKQLMRKYMATEIEPIYYKKMMKRMSALSRTFSTLMQSTKKGV